MWLLQYATCNQAVKLESQFATTRIPTRSEEEKMDAVISPDVLDIIIVGGGLSGIFLANSLSNHSYKWKVLEASDRLGGRLVNDPLNQIDLGGAWIWPSHQPHMRDLSNILVPTFQQPDDPSSTRFVGGAVQLVHELSKPIFESSRDPTVTGESILLRKEVICCKLIQNNSESYVLVETSDNHKYFSRHVVLAIPPKLISYKIKFDPPLSATKQASLNRSNTWMAGVTKVALIYPNRFWDLQSSNMGLPTNTGPAFQVYDSSTNDNSVFALTFFSLVPPDSPAQRDDALLAKQVATQMGTVWTYLGKPEYEQLVQSYTNFAVYRWPQNVFISGDDDRPKQIHPHPKPDPVLAEMEWDNRLMFAGTETDQKSPGVMEGAIGSAKRVLQTLISELS